MAQTMNPRPRPPSPTMRSKIQKERCKQIGAFSRDDAWELTPYCTDADAGTNPNTLTEKDAAILMDFAPYASDSPRILIVHSLTPIDSHRRGSPLMSGEPLFGSPQKAGDRRSMVKSSKTNAISQLQDEPDTVSSTSYRLVS